MRNDAEDRNRVGKVDQPVKHSNPPYTAASSSAALPGKRFSSALTIVFIFEPSDPLTMIASPARIAATTCDFERGRALGIAAPLARGKSVPQIAHQRTATIYQIDVVGLDRLDQAAMQLRRRSDPSSSMSPSTAMRRPCGPTAAWPSTFSAAAIEAGLAL